jgi:hypothetical protein
MQLNKFVPAVVAVWAWYLIFDNFLLDPVIGDAMAAIPGATTPSSLWVTIGDLAAALVLVWVYDRAKGSFGAGARNGLVYGFYAGVLLNFPTWLWGSVYFSWPYRSAWTAVIVLLVLTLIAGVLIGLVYEKVGGAAAPKA